jgi:hypothetical protein
MAFLFSWENVIPQLSKKTIAVINTFTQVYFITCFIMV